MSDAPLAIAQSSPNASTIVLKLDGPLVIAHLFQFQKTLREQTSPLTVLDLSGVPYMDSSGLGAILNGYVSAQKNGRKLVLAGVSDRVRALLQLTKVDTVLQSYPDAASAASGS